MIVSPPNAVIAFHTAASLLGFGVVPSRYHRQPVNVGLLNNFVQTIRLAKGTYFRWIGDDDRLEPTCVSRSLQAFDDRVILVTSQLTYTGSDGKTRTSVYDGVGLASDDPVERLREMLRMLNAGDLLIDPLYALVRRALAAAIPRRNMLREDEVFATKLALAGPWAHVPEVLAHRHWEPYRISNLARRLDVPVWQSHFANVLQFREILRVLNRADLTRQQRTSARTAVCRWYLHRQQRTLGHRGRKLVRIAVGH